MLDSQILNFWEEEIGHLSEQQAEFILARVKNHPHTSCLEIGFAGGRHTYSILKTFNPKRMISLDINFDYQGGRKKINQIKEEFPNSVFIEQDSKTAINKEFIKQYFPEGIDYALIDGGHQYEDAMFDMTNVYPFINQNGLMIVDDFKSKVCPLDQVDRAVNTFAENQKLSFEAVSLEDGKGMAIFTKNIEN